MLTKEPFEEYGKKQLKELIQKGEKPTIVAGFIDFFGDATVLSCSKCGIPVFVRPWLAEAVIEHDWNVVCILCVDPKDLKGQVAVDFSKIETAINKEIRRWIEKL